MGTHFTIDVDVGTFAQRFSVAADTGSNSLIVPSCVCEGKGQCSKKDQCFRGTNKSSTFSLEVDEEEKLVSMVLSFGSGQIQAIVAQEQVSGGKISRHLGLLLMRDRALQISGPFEGILGLGLPRPATNWTQIEEQEQVMRKILDTAAANANSTTASATALKTHKPHHRDSLKGFLEQVNIPRFSMYFNDGAAGVLRIGGAPMGNGSHGGPGTARLGRRFPRHLSVGSATATPVDFCRDSDMAEGQKPPCGAMPDSGAALPMGPAPQIGKLR
ncbi:unnamed protein product, partial [Prorocentrum cordatum]